MKCPVILLAMGSLVQTRLIGTNLVAKYRFPEGSCVIPNEVSYVYEGTSSSSLYGLCDSVTCSIMCGGVPT